MHMILVFYGLWYDYLALGWCNIFVYYINTSEIPSELSRENFISSHVKI